MTSPGLPAFIELTQNRRATRHFRPDPLAKALLPMLRPVMRLPSIPAVHRNFWLAKQAGLSAMAFMLAAEAAGLATCPMEGFDPVRVRKVLGLPRHLVPMIVMPLGRSATPGLRKTRLPIEQLAQYNRAAN